jgi:polar amino acid transport system substrate-binding protein
MNRRLFGASVLVSGLVAILLTGCIGSTKEETNNNTSTTQTNTDDASFRDQWSKDELVVGLDDAFPPIGFRDDNGDLIGFDIDLAREAASRMGLTVVFKPVVWDTVVLTLKSKEIDVVWNGMTITPEREEQINFSVPCLKSADIFIVPNGSTITTPEDLADKVVGVQSGSSQDQTLQASDFMSSLKEVRRYETVPEEILDLRAGRLDSILVDGFAGLYYITDTLKATDEFRNFDAGFGATYTGVGIRKEDTVLKTEIDRVLDEMKADGTAAEISNKWFGEDLIAR